MGLRINVTTLDAFTVSTFKYMIDSWGWKFYVPAGILGILGAAEWYIADTQFVSFAFILWTIGLYGIARSRIEERFFRGIALELGYSYEHGGTLAELDGNLFHRGRHRTVSHVLQGIVREIPLSLFKYYFVTGHGKHRQTHYYHIAELSFTGSVPEITIEPRSLFGGPNISWPDRKRLSISRAFDEQFAVSVNEHVRIEAFELLTPDVIADLLEESRRIFTLDFAGTKLYIIRDGMITRREDILALSRMAHYVAETLGMRIARLHDDVTAMHEAAGRIAPIAG